MLRHSTIGNRCVRYARVACAIAVALASRTGQAQGARVLRGVVTDSVGGIPVPEVEVSIDRVARTRTSASGEFVVADLEPGRHTITLRRIGFAPKVDTIPPRAVDTLKITYRLVSAHTELPSVTITTEQRLRILHMSGFDERRSEGFGKFLTEADWSARQNATLKDILQADVPGVYMNGDRVASRRGGMQLSGGPCYLTVWIDGIKAAEQRLDVYPVTGLAGVEIYRGASEVPLKYGGTNAQCGVLLIWTGRER